LHFSHSFTKKKKCTSKYLTFHCKKKKKKKMEISKVETFAYLVPKRERISNPISSSSQRIIASPADEEGFYLYLEGTYKKPIA
jgi:hypothetical protein